MGSCKRLRSGRLILSDEHLGSMQWVVLWMRHTLMVHSTGIASMQMEIHYDSRPRLQVWVAYHRWLGLMCRLSACGFYLLDWAYCFRVEDCTKDWFKFEINGKSVNKQTLYAWTRHSLLYGFFGTGVSWLNERKDRLKTCTLPITQIGLIIDSEPQA